MAVDFEKGRERAHAFFHDYGTVQVGRPHLHASKAAGDLRRALDGALPKMDAHSAASLQTVLAGKTALSSTLVRLAVVDLGVGKTKQTIEALLRFVDGDFGGEVDRPKDISRRVGILLPDHKLARELADRLNRIRPGVCFVWKGIEQPVDPQAPEGDTMCRRARYDVPTVLAAGGKLSDLCGSPKRGYCPHHPKSGVAIPCAHRLQRYDNEPLVVICGAGALTRAPPPTFNRKVNDDPIAAFDLVVVDEIRLTGFLGGFGPKPEIVATEAIDFVAGLAERKKKNVSALLLAFHRWHQLQLALKALGKLLHEATPITLFDLRLIEPLSGEWRDMQKQMFQLVELPDVDPNLTGEALRKALAPVHQHNGPIRQLTKLFRAIAQLLADPSLPNKTPVQSILRCTEGFRIFWREGLARSYSNVPTFLLDATADLGIVKALIPATELLVTSRALIPEAVEIIQVWDSLHPYAGWVPNPKYSERQTRRVHNNIVRLSDLLDVLVEQYTPGEVAAIVPLGLEKALRERWRKQGREGVRLAHFGAIRGQDAFRDVRCLVIWSRPSPPPDETERIAATIFSRPVQKMPKGERYPRGKGHYWMRDGSRQKAEPERDPDPLVERVRRQLVEAEVLQAIGRARAVWRTPEMPLTIIIGTSVPTELPINRLVRSADLFENVTPIEAVMARGLLVEPTKGFAPVFAAALGLKPKAVEDLLRSANGLRDRIAARLTSPCGSRWRIKLAAHDRYSISIWLRDIAAGDEEGARAFLRRFNNLDPAELASS